MARSLPADPVIRSLVTEARRAHLSRRTVLAGVGVGASALALAACAPGASGKPTPPPDNSARDKKVVWAARSGRVDTTDTGSHPTLQKFTDESGVAVNYDDTIGNSYNFFSKFKTQLSQGQDIGIDVASLSDWQTARLIDLGYIQELDHAELPNFTNLDPDLLTVGYDAKRQYTLPWQGGMTGICWNKAALPDGLRKVSELWGPTLAGHVGIVPEMRDTIGLIMLDQGIDISSDWRELYFDDASAFLERQLGGQIRFSKSSSYLQDLVNGDTVASICRSGDITVLNATHGDQWEFAIPDSGGVLWYDNFVVPIGSRRKANAEKLMNYYYEPEVAAEVAAWTGYMPPVEGAQAAMADIDPSLVDNQQLFPNAATQASVKQFRPLNAAESQTFEAAFQSLLLGA
ncbi:MAG TPA: spermidine/putrescine ABC transporter substrate-binding protein [Pseudolysinimonas sp.]|nr:spermidine/putrescine ABC transporter substrate-binding protein [Pseudolysinimonas sp.]